MLIQFVLEHFANRDPVGFHLYSSEPSLSSTSASTKLEGSLSTNTSDDGTGSEKLSGYGGAKGVGNKNSMHSHSHSNFYSNSTAPANAYGHAYGPTSSYTVDRSDFAALILTGDIDVDSIEVTETKTGTASLTGTGTGIRKDVKSGSERGGERGIGGGGGRGGGREVVGGDATLASHSTEMAHLAYAGTAHYYNTTTTTATTARCKFFCCFFIL